MLAGRLVEQIDVLTKSQVGYESPAQSEDHCSECKHWRAPSRCEIVSGVILPGDWCGRFVAMPAKSRAQQQAMAIAEHSPDKLSAKNKGLLKMSHGQLHDFASTKRKNLPQYAGKQKKGFRI